MNATFRPIKKWPKPGFEPHSARERSRFDSQLEGYPRPLALPACTPRRGRLGGEARPRGSGHTARRLPEVEREAGSPRCGGRVADRGGLLPTRRREVRPLARRYTSRGADPRSAARGGALGRGQRRAVRGVPPGARGGCPGDRGLKRPVGGREHGSRQYSDATQEADDPRGGSSVPSRARARHLDPVNADGEFVESAYRRAARKLHPDVGGDPEEFSRL